MTDLQKVKDHKFVPGTCQDEVTHDEFYENVSQRDQIGTEKSTDLKGNNYLNKLHSNDIQNQMVDVESSETVTLVYPSDISLMSSTDDRLVDLVEFSNMDQTENQLELATTTYNFGSTRVLLHPGFENESQISIMSTDSSDNQIDFMHSRLETNNCVNLYQNIETDVSKSSNSILAEPIMHLPSGDDLQVSRNISLPLSIVTENNSNSILQTFTSIPLTVSMGTTSSQIANDNAKKGRILPVSNFVKDSVCSKSFMNKSSKIFSNLSERENAKIENFELKKSKKLKVGQVGRPPKYESNKIIGTGASAISAEGIVQTIGNRQVTVLPRPEDLKRLVDTKKLVTLKGAGVRRTVTQGLKKNSLLIGSEKDSAKFSVEEIISGDANIKSYVNVKNHKKRGRKRKNLNLHAVSSNVRKPGRPKKVNNVSGVSRRPRIIHTGATLSKVSTQTKANKIEQTDQDSFSNSYKKSAEFDFFVGDLSKKVLPPRKKGTRYYQMLQAIQTEEEDDNVLCDGSIAGDSQSNDKDDKQYNQRRITKSLCNADMENSGTRIIQLCENLLPIRTTSCSKVLVNDGQDFEKEDDKKLVITFESLNDREEPDRNSSLKSSRVEMQINEDSSTNICVLPSAYDNNEEDMATILVKEEMYEGNSDRETSEYVSSKLNTEDVPFEKKVEVCDHNFSIDENKDIQCKLHLLDHNSDQSYGEESFGKDKKMKYVCDSCGNSFADKNSLLLHSIECSVKIFSCDICKASFESSSGLNKHRKMHRFGLDASFFKCSTCFANFTYSNSLAEHIRVVHDNTKTQGCADKTSIIAKLKEKLSEGYAPKNSELYDVPKAEELVGHADKMPFLCGACNESFSDVDVLCDHYNSSHATTQSFSCELCGIGCNSDQQLNRHMLIHEKEEKKALLPLETDKGKVCPYCSKTFAKAVDFDRHIKWHKQQKTLTCPYCDASFVLKSTLEKHKLVHTGQRPYVCDVCLKSFRQSASLIRHKLWTHSLKNRNKCQICSKTFYTSSLLLLHLDTHGTAGEAKKKEILSHSAPLLEIKNTPELAVDEDESLKCEYCGKKYHSTISLLSHKLVHKKSNSFCCLDCNRTFREKRYLRKHRLTHRGLKMWGCNICEKSFATKLTLIRHSQVHLREALRPDLPNDPCGGSSSSFPSALECGECRKTFLHKSHYVRHKLVHSGVPLLKCGICDRLFVHKSDIIRHKVMHSLMFSCDVCGRNFHKRSLYLIHKKRHLDSRPFKCDKCAKSFSSKGNYMTHMRIHSGEKPYHCNVCSYKCTQSGRLKRHKRMHFGLKPFVCEICKKPFSTMEALRSHAKLHSGHQPFSCQLCSKKFYNKPSLSNHLRDHEREQIFKCEFCHHKFRREQHLSKHRLFHEMKKDSQSSDAQLNMYMCDECGRVFDKRKYLYTHQNVHSHSNKFQCEYCLKTLGSRVGLKNHMMIHSGQMPFRCSMCPKEFRTISNLNRHKKVHAKSQETFSCDQCEETFDDKYALESHQTTHSNHAIPQQASSESVTPQMYVFVDDDMESNEQLLVDSNQQFIVDSSQSILVFPQAQFNDHSNAAQEASDFKLNSVSPVLVRENNDFIIPKSNCSSDVKAPVSGYDSIVKPHECDVCHKTFAKKQYLTKHKYRHRQVKPHGCEVCGKTFAQKFEVGVHMMKHTGHRPFRCDICMKDFRSRANLTNHKMRHTGEYPFMCSVCDKGMSTQLQLEKHVSLHTGTYPFFCDECERGFSTKLSMSRHLFKVHNIIQEDPMKTIAQKSTENDSVRQEIGESQLIKKEPSDMNINVQNIDLSEMTTLEETTFSVQDQNPYLKSCLISGQEDMEQKFFNSILHQDDGSCHSDSSDVNLSLLSADLDNT